METGLEIRLGDFIMSPIITETGELLITVEKNLAKHEELGEVEWERETTTIDILVHHSLRVNVG